MSPQVSILSFTAARRLRILLLAVGTVSVATLWDISSAWRWYTQSFSILAAGAVIYFCLVALRKLGNLPTLLPGAVEAILLARPRPLVAPFSLVALATGLCLGLATFLFSPGRNPGGYNISVRPAQPSESPFFGSRLEDVLLQPFDLPALLSSESTAVIHISGLVLFPSDSTYKAKLFSSSGQTGLYLDGQKIGSIPPDPADRVIIVPVKPAAGWHLLEIVHTTAGAPPTLDLDWERQTDSGYRPIHLKSVRGVHDCVNAWRHRLSRVAATIFLVTSTLILVSVFTSWVSWHVETLPRLPHRAMTGLLLVVSLVGGGWTRFALLNETGPVVEADEAAFGLMAQRLLRGELPPIFHYGQPYQGTIEVFPLAALFRLLGETPETLKLEPLIVYLLFSLVLVCLYGRLCTLAEALVLVGMLVCSPFLLMWISLKAWFGYTESLLASALIVFSTYKLVYTPGARDLCWAVGLGLVSGLSLYILPFTLPVILSAFLILFRCRGRNVLRTGTLAVAITLGVAVLPYLLHDMTSEQKSASFLLRGRELGAPRVPGERPFRDRFLNECLPVILGGRTTYDNQRDVDIHGLPRVMYLIFAAGVLILVMDLRDESHIFIIRGGPPGRLLFVLPALLAVPVGIWSPFGIWPWYFLPMYLGLPLAWTSFLRWSFRYIRPVAVLSIPICLAVWAGATTDRSELMFQPASLVQCGVLLRQDNRAVIDTLLKYGVDHVICDQGADFAPQNTGRDWMGERLTFESRLRINAVHPLTRRHPHLFADSRTADRVAYLFRRSFFFWDIDHVKDPGYQPITFDILSRLFGPDYLGYTRVDLGQDVIFIPPPDHPSNGKGLWRVTGNRGWYFERMHDHSISTRVYGPTYWSSGPPGQRPGDFIEVDTGRIMPMRGLVMYHGAKPSDRPRACKILVSQDHRQWWDLGRTKWDPAACVTWWRHSETFHARYIRIELTESADTWWTIYELWII